MTSPALNARQTIFALASGSGRSGVAVVRISGPQSRFVLETIAGKIPQPRYASLQALHDGQGETIDDALVLWFPAPHSFTGEDCVEFQVHGGRAVVSALLNALGALQGCRLAEAGEFSRRAFLNGKLDLAQAEGLADLIDAESEAQRKQALYQLDGALGARCADWRGRIIGLQALVEAEIDFSDEDDVDALNRAAVIESATKLYQEFQTALAGFAHSARVRQGLTIVISGPPNAGKSSLLNYIAQRDAALVSSVAGTTRDLIEVSVVFFGEVVTFVDTAGIRDSVDEIEKLGIERAQTAQQRADLILGLGDFSPATDSAAPLIRIATKRDLAGARPVSVDHWISTKTGEGMDKLFGDIRAYLNRLPRGNGLVTRQRHAEALTQASLCLSRVMAAHHTTPIELLAEDLRLAGQELARLVGAFGVEDVLGSLFSSFCIGK